MNSSNEVMLNTSFVLGSVAKGVLYAFMYINGDNDIDFTESVYIPVSKLDAVNGTFQTVSEGRYRVLSFDIESNYSIQSRGLPADITESFNISGSSISGVLLLYSKLRF